ncbi:hypothetical protein HF329_00700 [Chitinophaga oryzae]|uniref:Uncharacterized protein n=1 Tax=Chitinophaga oryzae TaxID=2725414 RepID=A0AAE6ZDJ8_9BACT|nr:hypothetical protein [Chitinophaga oryzae]QJB29902.1 hypothetical protein HF329_00700 [Chitinophaga oryzae]
MDGNVYTFNEAIAAGYEPRDYLFDTAHLPTGTVHAYLDFKIWTKSGTGITCFFREDKTDKKFRLTVFRRKDIDVYALDDRLIDFKTCPLNLLYQLVSDRNGNGNIVLRQADIKDKISK